MGRNNNTRCDLDAAKREFDKQMQQMKSLNAESYDLGYSPMTPKKPEKPKMKKPFDFQTLKEFQTEVDAFNINQELLERHARQRRS